MAQIEMVDGLMIRILSTEEAGLEKCCRLNFEFFGRAAQPPCHLSDDAAQPPWRRVAADKRHPRCRGCGNTGGGRLPTHAKARAFLENFAKRRIPITYQALAKALQILRPHSIHRVTEALERLMEEDAAADRPFIAALAIRGAWRPTRARVLRLRPTSRPVRGRSGR